MASRGGARPASLDTRRGSASPRRGGPSARGIGARLATRLPAGRDRPPTRHRRYCRGPRPRRHRTRLADARSEEHTSELQSQSNLVCRLLLEKKKKKIHEQKQRIHKSRLLL